VPAAEVLAERRTDPAESGGASQGPTHDDRPSLWGRPFDGPMTGHDPGMPVHYDLHVWLYDSNPAGVFAPWNPSVSC
jgi:hypothetical protein